MDVRYLVDPPRDGPTNMGIDEALLLSASAGVATFRFYGWSEPTLSLGYFQGHADRQSHGASLTCPLVRRHSGGGAILHDRELTYSLAIPLADERRDTQPFVTAVHESLVSLLRGAGVDASLATGREAVPDGPRDGDGRPFLCFQRRAAGDVLVRDEAGGEYKVLGSAQRRWRGALLQHGSLLLARSDFASELPGLGDLRPGMETFFSSLREQWAATVGLRLQWGLLPSTMTEGERNHADRERETRYRDSGWTFRR